MYVYVCLSDIHSVVLQRISIAWPKNCHSEDHQHCPPSSTFRVGGHWHGESLGEGSVFRTIGWWMMVLGPVSWWMTGSVAKPCDVCSFHPMPWCTAQADAEDRPESGFAALEIEHRPRTPQTSLKVWGFHPPKVVGSFCFSISFSQSSIWLVVSKTDEQQSDRVSFFLTCWFSTLSTMCIPKYSLVR